MARRRPARTSLSILLLALLVPNRAHAASPLAEALFQEGKRLLEEGRTDEACVKLGESFAQEASSGTLLNLALCHETQGRLATAWAEYRAAARLSHTQGRQDRAATAEEKALSVEPRLPRLTILQTDPAQSISVAIDGSALGAGALGVPVPVDPGTRTVSVSGTGLVAWTARVEMKEGEARTLQVPVLEAKPTPVSAPAPVAAPAPLVQRPSPKTALITRETEHRGGSSTWGWAVAGGGVTLLGVGTVFGLVSLDHYRDAERTCPHHVDCSTAALADAKSANVTAWVSNITLGVGAVATGVGTVLLLSSRSDRSEARASLLTAPMPGGAWAGLDGRF